MPKSFLVKNKKAFYSPIPIKGPTYYSAEKNGVISPHPLIRSSHSAFESFGNKLKNGKRDNYITNGDTGMSKYVLSSSFSSSFPERRYEDDFKDSTEIFYRPNTATSDLVQDDFSEDQRSEALKENIKDKGNDHTLNFPVVKGPLPQSTFICQLCKQVYNDAFSLAQHKCSGIKHVEHRCPECSKVFSCPANLASHRRWHRPRSPTSNKPLKLSKSKSVKNTNITSGPLADVLKKVTDQQQNNEDSGGESDPSDIKNVDIDRLQDENNNSDDTIIENGAGEFSCKQCGKTFRRQAYLRKHVNYHANNRPYPCQYCGKVFRSLTNRAKHVLNHAIGPKGNVCEICGNRFSNKSTLEKHIRIHNGEIFSCGQCSSTFYSAPGLQRHVTKCHSETEEALDNVPVSER